MLTYCCHGVDVPDFNGAIKASGRQQVWIVRLELAVEYSLDMALQREQDINKNTLKLMLRHYGLAYKCN